MRRAVQSGAASAAPPASRLASAGNPSQGDPSGGVAATILGDRWFYEVQENIIRVIEEAGLTPSSDPDQLKDAIDSLIGGGGTSNSDIDARIASWARENSPSGRAPTSRVASELLTQSEGDARYLRDSDPLIPVAWMRYSNGVAVGEGIESVTFSLADERTYVVLSAGIVTGADYAVNLFSNQMNEDPTYVIGQTEGQFALQRANVSAGGTYAPNFAVLSIYDN